MAKLADNFEFSAPKRAVNTSYNCEAAYFRATKSGCLTDTEIHQFYADFGKNILPAIKETCILLIRTPVSRRLKVRLQALVLIAALSGCAAVYIPADVREDADGLSVEVVDVTAQTVRAANSNTPYAPRQLPDAFLETAGTEPGLRGLGALPENPFQPAPRPTTPVLRAPPVLEQSPYVIGVGDVLVLATPTGGGSVEELSGLLAAQNRRQGYTVQDDRTITIPDVGRIEVGGLTLARAEDAIFSSLIDRQIDPSFSVEIAEFNSQRFSVGGAVNNPSVLPISLGPVYLNEALAAVGGTTISDTEFASIRIYRDGELYQIPWTDYANSSEWQRIPLTDGDSIFVDTSFQLAQAEAYFEQQIRLFEIRRSARADALSELQTEINIRRAQLEERRSNFETQLDLGAVDRDFIYLTGEVDTPQRYPMPFNGSLSLADALFEAGGIAESTGNPRQIYVLRQEGGNPGVTAYRLDGSNVVNMVLATQMELRPSDIIFVAEQPVTRWNRAVRQIVPSLITSGVRAATN